MHLPLKKNTPKDKYNDYMKKLKPKKYTTHKKLICDCTDKKKYSICYRMLKFYDRHRMIVEKIHEIISLKQSRWLEKNISCKTRKRN